MLRRARLSKLMFESNGGEKSENILWARGGDVRHRRRSGPGRPGAARRGTAMTPLDRLRERLPDYTVTELPLNLPEAAVLMPFVDGPDPELILTVRSLAMPTHPGEVAFPGGKRDPGDRDLRMTALRESREEVGLPYDQVEVLGRLSPLASRFGMKVTPFVGLVAPGVELVPEPGEIETIFQVPLSFFLEQTPELSAPMEIYGRRLRMPSYYFEDKRIWGLTAFMILDLINHVYDVDVHFDLTGQ